jgi:hypothetical protein
VQVVKISVMNFNLATCSTGEVEITIQISNLSGKRMTLPWNPDGAEVVDPARNPTFHDLAVTILEPNGTDRKTIRLRSVVGGGFSAKFRDTH